MGRTRAVSGPAVALAVLTATGTTAIGLLGSELALPLGALAAGLTALVWGAALLRAPSPAGSAGARPRPSHRVLLGAAVALWGVERIGVTRARGPLWSRAVPPERLPPLLERRRALAARAAQLAP